MATHGRYRGSFAAVLALLSICSSWLIAPSLAAEGSRPPVAGQPNPPVVTETAAQPEIRLRSAPVGPSTGSLELDLGAADSGDGVFWLAGEASSLPANLLHAHIQGAKVELTVMGVNAGQEFTLPPVRQVEVAVSKVDKPGRFRGTIYAIHDNLVSRLASLLVTRRGALRPFVQYPIDRSRGPRSRSGHRTTDWARRKGG